MKYLLILLSFNCMAAYRLSITPTDTTKPAFSIEKETNDFNQEIVELHDKHSYLTGSYTDFEADSVASKQVDVDGVDVTKYLHPASYTVVISDTTAEDQVKAIEEAIEQKIHCGQETIKFIAKNNVLKGLTQTQIKSMSETYATIFSLLSGGGIDTARTEIQNTTADGTIITEADKTAIIAMIDSCN